jgi:hypothetical protein
MVLFVTGLFPEVQYDDRIQQPLVVAILSLPGLWQ